MLNQKFRKESIEKFENAVSEYNQANEMIVCKSEKLYTKREELKATLVKAYQYINSLKNTPEIYKVELNKIELNLQNYDSLILTAKMEIKKTNIKDNKPGGSATAGLAARVGVAALAPTTAMGIATTFGIASTGTAIASLSGAAATNAALAWLGGGALAAGGSGIAGGSALLALAGPIGWGVAGVGIAGAGLFQNGKNKKIAYEALQKTSDIEASTKMQESVIEEISQLISLSDKNNLDISESLSKAAWYPKNYSYMSDNQKFMLGSLLNNISSASQSINQVVGS